MTTKQIKALEKLSIREVLRWSDKHRKLTGEGARVVHIKQLLSIYREELIGNLEPLLVELWQQQKLFAEHIEGRMVLHPEAIEKIKEMG